MPTKQKPLEKADPEKEIEEKLIKLLEKPVTAPPIEEAMEAAQQAIAAANNIKQRELKNHYCTECGATGIQLYHREARMKNIYHFKCYITEDNEYCDEYGEPFTDPDKLEAIRQVKASGRVDK